MRTSRRDELDLVPLLNVVTLLIPMLLLTADLRPTAVVPVDLPMMCGGCGSCCEVDEPPLSLTVAIQQHGFIVRGHSSQLADDGLEIACRVPGCPRGTWDTKALAELMDSLKRQHPSDWDAVLVPTQEVTTDTLLAALDVIRGPDARPRFPRVTVAGGALEPDL